MNKSEKTISYLNQQTGEIHEKKSYVDMLFDEETGYAAWTNKKGTKTYNGNHIPKVFTWAEKGRIEELKHYILRDNQFLVYRSHNVIKPIGVTQLQNIFELSLDRSRKLIRKLKQHSIIKEVNFDNTIYYSFNPIYGIKDKRITLTLFIIFQEELTDMIPPWVISKFIQQAAELKPMVKVIK